jgi:sugar phosphate isomerase/epimerase
MISVSHLTALDAPPEEFIPYAARAGFTGVGLRILPPKHAQGRYPVVGDAPRVKHLRRLADDEGIQIFEAESFGIDVDTNPRDMIPALEAAAELGASFIVSGGIDPEEDRLATRYAELAEEAGRFGIGMVIEFMPSRPMATLQDALRVMGKVSHPNAKLLIDVLHLVRSGGTVADVGRLDLPLIGYIHLCDAPAEHPGQDNLTQESREGRLFPGEGQLELAELMNMLPPTMPVSLEAPHLVHGSLPPKERLAIAGRATLTFMESVRGGTGRADTASQRSALAADRSR